MCMCLIACNPKGQEIKKAMKELIGKQIQLPQRITLKQLTVDSGTITLSHPDIFVHDSIFRICTYIYGNCHACVSILKNWEKVMDKLPQENVKYLFFVYAEIFPSFEINNEKSIKFRYPVIYDHDCMYLKNNNITDDKLLNTVLINKDNEVVLVGNPTMSDNILNLYRSELINK